MGVQVRLFAAAREALGAAEVEVAAGSVADICAALVVIGGEQTARVLAVSSFACDGHVHRFGEAALIPEGSVLDVLPPFAGG